MQNIGLRKKIKEFGIENNNNNFEKKWLKYWLTKGYNVIEK